MLLLTEKKNIDNYIATDSTNTKVLLHFDDAKNPWKDECGNVWTAYGSPTLSTDNARFNKGYYNSSGVNGGINSSSVIEIGGSDFTIDFYGYMSSSTSSYGAFFETSRNEGNNLGASVYPGIIALIRNYTYNRLQLALGDAVGNPLYGSSCDIIVSYDPINKLNHYALVYEHSKKSIKLFVNGSLINNLTLKSYIVRSALYWHIGSNPYSNASYGYLVGTVDEFRAVDGVAVWKENFTPPIKPYSL